MTDEEIVAHYQHDRDNKWREILIRRCLSLIRSWAWKNCAQNDYPDLVSEGMIGLLRAIDAYRPDRKATFKTFASWRIRGAIMHYKRDRVPFIHFPHNRLERGEHAPEVLLFSELDDDLFRHLDRWLV